MTISKAETQITWGAANSVVIASASTTTSDAFSVPVSAVSISILVKASANGTPDDTDKIEFILLRTVGDPDGAGADEYETKTQGQLLATTDCNLDNPALVLVEGLGANFTSGKIYAVGKGTATSYHISATTYIAKSE